MCATKLSRANQEKNNEGSRLKVVTKSNVKHTFCGACDRAGWTLPSNSGANGSTTRADMIKGIVRNGAK